MTTTYRAASAESRYCLTACAHDHQTVYSAVACISCAEGYVVAFDDGVLRALSDLEELEFQEAMRGQKAHSARYADCEYLFRARQGLAKPT